MALNIVMLLNDQKILKTSMLIALSAILYGFLGYVGTGMLHENMTISTMLFWRFLVAGCFLFFCSVKKGLYSRIVNDTNQHVLIIMFFAAAISYAVSSGCYFLAGEHTGTSITTVLFFSYPLVIAFFSWLIFGKKMQGSIMLALGVVVFGLLLLRDPSVQALGMMGVLFGMMTSCFYTVYTVGGKYISKAMLDTRMLSMMFCVGWAIIFLIYALSIHGFSLPSSSKNVLWLLAMGILATALPVQFMFAGLKYVSSKRAAMTSVLEPWMTAICGIIFINKSTSSTEFLVIMIIIGSGLFIQFHKN